MPSPDAIVRMVERVHQPALGLGLCATVPLGLVDMTAVKITALSMVSSRNSLAIISFLIICDVFVSNHILSFYPIFPILSYRILAYPIPSYPIPRGRSKAVKIRAAIM